MFNSFELQATSAAIAIPALALLLFVPLSPGSGIAARIGEGRAFRAAVLGLAVYVVGLVAVILLPLPADPDTFCRAASAASVEVAPFRWVRAAIVHADEQGQRLTVQGFLHNVPVFQAVFNLLLFVPLGVGLRRLFGRGLGAVIAAALGVSLALEALQGTGLLGLYPCAYRVADLDDLMLNTIGGALGWFVGAQVGRTTGPVGAGRRVVAFVLDLMLVEGLLSLANAAASGLEPVAYAAMFALAAAVVFVVPAVLLRGLTFGKALAGIRLVQRGGDVAAPWRITLRYVLLLGLPVAAVLWPQLWLDPLGNEVTSEKGIVFIGTVLVLALLGPGVMFLRRDRRGLHDIVARTDHRPRVPAPSAAGSEPAPPATAADG